MKKIVKFLSVVLSFFVVAIDCHLLVYANIQTGTSEVSLLQEGDFDIYDSNSGLKYEKLEHYGIIGGLLNTQSFEEYVYEELLDCSDSIYVYNYNINIDDFSNIYSNIINDNPDLFYVSSSISYRYTSSNYVYDIQPKYSMTSDEIANAKVIFNNGVNEALSHVNDSMSDVQKALVLHDYICDVATYPVLNSSADDKEIYHSAYGFFFDGNIVCAGYTLVYSYLLNQLGIESKYVTSKPMAHAWNAVKIDGKWYNVDITWDDMTLYNNSMNLRGGMFHSCFLKSDDAFSGKNGYCHYGGTTYENYQMNDTSYDDYFWNSVCSNINVIDGDYYYFDYDGESFKGYLTKRDSNGNEEQIGNSIQCIKNKISGVTYDENNNAYSHSIIDPFVRIVYLDNRFYLTTVRELISIDLEGNRNSITSDSNYCFGLGIEGDELVYQSYSSWNTTLLDKKEYFEDYLSTPSSNNYNNYPDINNDGVVNAKDYSMIIK